MMLTPAEGVRVFPSDVITIELVQPWYLRWRPGAKVRLWITVDGHLHAERVVEDAA